MSPVKGRPSRDNNGYSSSDDDDVNGAPMFAPRQSVDSRLELTAQVACGIAFASVLSLLFLGFYYHILSLLLCPVWSLWLRHMRCREPQFTCCLSRLLPACLPLRCLPAVHLACQLFTWPASCSPGLPSLLVCLPCPTLLACLPACLRVPFYLPFPVPPTCATCGVARQDLKARVRPEALVLPGARKDSIPADKVRPVFVCVRKFVC
jgi:hypothetical protein